MHRIDSTILRRLVPAFAVGGVLALSLFVSEPSLASNGESGYGNNCGVKGTGYHDHGKVCPNRPFPGKGIVESTGQNDTSPAGPDSATISNHGKAKTDNPITTAVVRTSTQSSGGDDASSTGKGHGHGQGHGRGNGHNK